MPKTLPDTGPPPAFDALEGITLPQQQTALVGHTKAKEHFDRLVSANTLHHAYILAGGRGIGKSTFAYALARFLFDLAPDASDVPALAGSFVSHRSQDITLRQVGQLSHPNLFVLQRRWDFEKKRFTNGIPIDDVRRLVRSLFLSAAQKTWRVCLIDSADDMAPAAFNALLKTLEEPPSRTLFLLVSHNSGQLAATLCSRCQMVRFHPLSDTQTLEVLEREKVLAESASTKTQRLLGFARGSPRRAIVFERAGGFKIAEALEEIFKAFPSPGYARCLKLAEHVALSDSEDAFTICCELILDHLNTRIRDGAEGGVPASRLVGYAHACKLIKEKLHHAQVFNLDKRTTMLSLLHSVRMSRTDPES